MKNLQIGEYNEIIVVLIRVSGEGLQWGGVVGERGRSFTMYYHLLASWTHRHILIVRSPGAWCTFDFEVHFRHCLPSKVE